MDIIRFGTDGWRDRFAGSFTAHNVRRVAQAYAEHLLDGGGGLALVGYDTRRYGREFALAAAEVIAANGIEVSVSGSFLPTPALSFAVKRLGAAGGVMLTASHNPSEYGGFKLKGPYGGTATDDVYQDVQRRVSTIPGARRGGGDAQIGEFDVRADYYDGLARLVDVGLLGRATGTLVHDAMGGAGCGWLAGFARHVGLGLTVEELRGTPDPRFHGVNPEPIPANLALTLRHMGRPPEARASSRGGRNRPAAAAGSGDPGGPGGPAEALGQAQAPYFAAVTDGDADRLGVVLPGGVYFTSHQILAILLDHLATKATGRVVKTFNVSRIVELLARRRSLQVVETPVGFKYLVSELLAGDVLVAGEESGGFAAYGYLPERDGIANALLLLEAVLADGRSLARRFADIERETGWRHAYDRLDLALPDDGLKDRLMKGLDEPPATLANRPVTSVERLDGVKLNLGDDAWLLLRASGTEPLLRLYCEGPDAGSVGEILAAARLLVAAA